MKKLAAILTVIVVAYSWVSYAASFECATPESDPDVEGIPYPYEPEIEYAKFRVFFHGLLIQGEEEYGVTAEQLQQAYEILSADYAEHNIYFTNMGIDFVVLGTGGLLNPHGLEDAYGSPDVIDVFLGNENFSEQNGGGSGSSPSTVFYVVGPRFLSSLLTHEMGHCLGLEHVFETVNGCVDDLDGTDCDVCGDLVCDTAPYPAGLQEIEPYVDSQTCLLVYQFEIDYPGGYDPDPKNYMSYSVLDCMTLFTPEQVGRMLCTIEQNNMLADAMETVDSIYDNVSGQTSLAYSGQPYSAVGIDYYNPAGQPRAYEDLFVTMTGGNAELFRCDAINFNGVPYFVQRTFHAFGAFMPDNLRGISQADYDNDGNLDLFIAGGVQELARLYRNDGDGTFTEESGLLGAEPQRQNVQAGAWADYDGDGWIDLYACRGGGPDGGVEPDYLWRNRIGFNGTFMDATTSEGIDAGGANLTNSIAAIWADVNGDDLPDLFVAESDSLTSPPDPAVHCRLFVHDASPLGGFTEEASSWFADFIDVMQQVTAVDMADVDADGFVDLVAGYESLEQGAVIYVNNGNGNFEAEDSILLPDREGTSGVRFLDQDLDGRPDLLVTSIDSDIAPALYRNTTVYQNDLAFFNDTPHVFHDDAGTQAEGLVSLDWNRDGDQDLFVGRQNTSGQYFYRTTRADGETDHPSQNVIALKLSSPVGVNNAAAIGAKVESDFQGRTLAQWVDGGSSRGGQDDLVLTFPVEQESGPVSVTVTWPNGWQQFAQVPLHVPEDAPYLLVDDTNPSVVDDTVSASTEYDPIDDEMTFVFTWQTEYGFDASLDKVTLDLSQVPSRCQPSVSEITPATPGAEHTYLRLNTGNYRHTLRWTGWDCEPICTLPYTVTSTHWPGISSTSATKQLKITFCPTSL